MSNKIFTISRLVINDAIPSLSHFSTIPENQRLDDNELINDDIVKNRFVELNIRDDRFLCFYIEEGASLPRPPQVYNIDDDIDEDNPRQTNQIERDQQTFIMLDLTTSHIYFSNFKKRQQFKSWFETQTQNEIVLHNIIDKEDFLTQASNIKSLFFAASPNSNLLQQMGTLGSTIEANIHNFGPSLSKIEMKLKFNAPSGDYLERIKEFAREATDSERFSGIDKIEVSGLHDDKFERVFNGEAIVDKISIDCTPNPESALYDKLHVFQALIHKINA